MWGGTTQRAPRTLKFCTITHLVNWGPDSNFQAFTECFHNRIPSDREISPSLQEALSRFTRRVSCCHSGKSICYAATENFVVEHGDEIKVLGCVAVLREKYDFRPNFDDRAGNLARCRKDMIFDFSLQTVTHSPLSDWIQAQVFAALYTNPRICFALWNLGRLPPASHSPDSKSFRWLRQSLSTIVTGYVIAVQWPGFLHSQLHCSCGPRNVVEIASGDPRYPFRRVHQYIAQIAHRPNAAYRLDLAKQMQQEMLAACEESCEEWYIGVSVCKFSMTCC